MTQHRHEIPTHLGVEDRAFYGLTVRQVMYLTVGLASGYSLWTQWPMLPLPVHLVLIALCLALALILALVRPHDRGLDEWAFVALHYLTLPKASVWRRLDADQLGQGAEMGWEELAPRLAWPEDAR